MAKGWESKSVSDQIESSQESSKGKDKGPLTLEQMEARRVREVLLLSRMRVERDLQTCQNPRYREQLVRALADLDMRISSIKNSG